MAKFFDKIENRIRSWLSRKPILYALIVGTGIVLFWRGTWHTLDFLSSWLYDWHSGGSMSLFSGLWWDGPLSILLGVLLLLLCGAFVSSFIGNEVILSGLRGEKKFSEKTEREIRYEANAIAHMQESLEDLHKFIKKHKK